MVFLEDLKDFDDEIFRCPLMRPPNVAEEAFCASAEAEEDILSYIVCVLRERKSDGCFLLLISARIKSDDECENDYPSQR